MLRAIQIRNFKSWRESGELALAPLTGFFGTNSSGKSSIIQALLALKMTSDSPDSRRVLETGDYGALVELGSFSELIYGRDAANTLLLRVAWDLSEPLRVSDPKAGAGTELFSISGLDFSTKIRQQGSRPAVVDFAYKFAGGQVGMRMKDSRPSRYDLAAEGFTPVRIHGRPWPLPPPVKCYRFPDEAVGYYQNTGFLPLFPLELESMLDGVHYLGPVREWPRRQYRWNGEAPETLDFDGERAVHALLAARAEGRTISQGRGRHRKSLEEMVGYWMDQLDLLKHFSVRRIAENRNDYEVIVRRGISDPAVPLPDVGFGVSQLLPVVTLLYYAPPGSTIMIEHPEMHLHPAAQSALADMLIDAATRQKVQLIVESHSEHLVRRLQRRIAEQKLSAKETALYFCKATGSGSRAERLEISPGGDIVNWPEGFFGDEFGDVAARIEAAEHRGAAD